MKSIDYSLNAKNIDITSENIVSFLESANMEKETISRNRLLVEELLLDCLNKGISNKFTLVLGYRFKKPVVSIEIDGAPCNTFEKDDEETSALTSGLLKSIKQIPNYSYHDGRNIITLNFSRRPKSSFFKIIIAILLALVCGFGINYLLPSGVGNVVLSNVVEPLYSAIFRALSCVAGPLILVSVMWGIYGIGDTTTLGNVGKKIITKNLLLVFIVTFLCGLITPLFNLEIEQATGGASAFKSIFEMILDIIPKNIVDPFINGNTLQLIFMAVVLGVAMLFLGKKIKIVADMVEQVNSLVQYIMEIIIKLMPGLIFLVFVRLILSDSLSVFLSVWKMVLICVLLELLFSFVLTIVEAIRFKVSPILLIKKNLPTFLICLTTASSTAAFLTNVNACEKKFGIDNRVCSFGVPVSMVLSKTATSINYFIVSLFFAEQFGVGVSISWIISAIVISAMLAIATPTVPGGSIAAYTMLFAKLGIPVDALAILLSIDIFLDFVRTAIDVYNIPLTLLGVAKSVGKLDLRVLRSEKLVAQNNK